jgi:serine/threonine protein kinase
MAFQPNAFDFITLNNHPYLFGEHPGFSGMPFGQEGRQGCVYQLVPNISGMDTLAMKVFKPNFRIPSLVYRSDQMRAFSTIEGLKVCDRTVIIPENEFELLAKQSDLMYAAVMPWIHGPTWYDILMDKQPITRAQSYEMAGSMAKVLSSMEQKGLAHCDLSAANIMLPGLVNSAGVEINATSFVELVDVEQMFGLALERPELLPTGSPGYAFQQPDKEPVWNKYSDRFSGAILLSEMLAWSIKDIREASWGDSYFDPEEMNLDSERSRLMHDKLEEHWGAAIANLFSRTWNSEELVQCPSFGEWYIAVMSSTERIQAVAKQEEPIASILPVDPPMEVVSPSVSIQDKLAQARELEKQGQLDASLGLYSSIQMQLLATDSLHREIGIHLVDLSKRILLAHEKLHSAKTPADIAPMGSKLKSKKPMMFAAGGLAVLIICVILIFNASSKKGDTAEVNKVKEEVVTTSAPIIIQEPTVEPTPVTPEPTPTATPKPTPTLTPEPKPTIKPTPASTASVKATVRRTPRPTPRPTPKPTVKPTATKSPDEIRKEKELNKITSAN